MDAASHIARRRKHNPVREARRQAHLTRMLRRVVDFVPTYRDTRDHTGQIVSSIYLRHEPVTAVRGGR